MLFGHTTISSSNNRLGVRYHTMYPRHQLACGFRIPKKNSVVSQTLALCGLTIGSPPIRSNRFHQRFPIFGCLATTKPFQKARDRLRRSIVYNTHMRKTWFLFPSAISIQRNRVQHGAFRLAPSTMDFPGRAEETFIHLNQSGKTISRIPGRHRLSYLMSHKPRGFILPNTQYPLHFGDRYPHLVHRHVINQPVPFQERHSCAMKDRSRSHTGLSSAFFAYKKLPFCEVPPLIMPAARTFKSVSPSLLSLMLGTSIRIRKTLLKTDKIALLVCSRHRLTPCRKYRLGRVSEVHKHFPVI
jgi:hypothetical protein